LNTRPLSQSVIELTAVLKFAGLAVNKFGETVDSIQGSVGLGRSLSISLIWVSISGMVPESPISFSLLRQPPISGNKRFSISTV
jgi:hypothetical protein